MSLSRGGENQQQRCGAFFRLAPKQSCCPQLFLPKPLWEHPVPVPPPGERLSDPSVTLCPLPFFLIKIYIIFYIHIHTYILTVLCYQFLVVGMEFAQSHFNTVYHLEVRVPVHQEGPGLPQGTPDTGHELIKVGQWAPLTSFTCFKEVHSGGWRQKQLSFAPYTLWLLLHGGGLIYSVDLIY